MVRALFVTFVAILGCAKPAPPPATPPSTVAPTAPDPREKDAEIAYNLDAASASIETALTKTKALVAKVDGEAKEALTDIAEALDSAGSTLADHDSPPPEGQAFTEKERKEVAQAAADALGDLEDAGKILDDLAQNAPPEFEASLTAIRNDVDEATDAIEGTKSEP